MSKTSSTLTRSKLLLPAGGIGFLGLNDGPATPLMWAALFAIYAVVLQFGDQDAPGLDAGRRRVLSALPLGIAGFSVLALAYRLGPDWYQAIFRAAESGLRGISPAITPVQNFYVVSKNFSDPSVDGQAWKLTVSGMVNRTLSLSLPAAVPPWKMSRSGSSTLAGMQCLGTGP